MNNKKEKKEKINVVYSTDPNFQYEYDEETEAETLAPEKQNLRVSLDSKQRKGKIVTLVQGFIGTENDLKELAKLLKNKCGVGGSVKDGEIIIQGELKEKILTILKDNNYRAK
ncbi:MULTISPECIES: translation initiation factor [Porphyromonadaceae]|uniref:Translation initiation factor 1 n=1 Tax=Sanguibacteroides justesenii TaxID=1547597 RepID=A0A0C3RAN0_9PORP|nr:MULTISPECIES: translation initiation factor [Porphyromonadaceae]KIO42515.1 translation initiation factor 1 [Sanguibacteroides justesenii]KIO42601.1 translation initiation factor 1 [Sanguibacteroides justesenii]PXZ42988.1 translation initiation factor [Sanguibacteroides justesenii]